jgi:isocitrate dehydrogenase (NAD+)
MTRRVVTLIPGDGIGPEVTGAALAVVEAAGVEIEWEVREAGAAVAARHGTPCPDEVLDSIRRNRVALKGPITTPIGGGFRSVNVAIRRSLDLYACVRPVRNLRGVPSRYEGVNLVIVRENTEGMYSGLEHVVVPGVVEAIKVVTERASARIAEFAFRHARSTGRRRVTIVHKANIMKLSDGLFLDTARRVAAAYRDIQADEMIVDACAMQLVRAPERFEVLVMGNLYGDIMSDLCAGLVGGLGVVPGANIGEECAVFEPVHGSAPDIAGRNVANPTATILSAALMLEQMGDRSAATAIEQAVARVYAESSVRTRDLGGTATTTEFTDAVIAHLR